MRTQFRGGSCAAERGSPWLKMCLDPDWRSGKKIFFFISSALCSFAVAVMSKAVSTDLSSGFSSLDWQPWIRATKQQRDGTNLLLLPARAADCHTADFKVESIFITLTNSRNSYISALHGTLHPKNSLSAAERFKTHYKSTQMGWFQAAGSSERGEVAACGTWRSQPVPPTKCQSLHVLHRDHPLPRRWWNRVRNRIADIYWLLRSFPAVLWVCVFIFNLIFKSWKRIHLTKNETKTKSKTTTKNLPRRHETYLSKNNDVVLQKVNKEEIQWHYIIEIQDKCRLNMNIVQKRGEKAGNIFYSQQSPSFHNKTWTHLVDLQNLQRHSPHLFQLMGTTAAICNFMMW